MQYVLITAARNEAHHLGRLIDCVVSQTRLPQRWVVVSDGSVDGTDELVKAASARHPWIELERIPAHQQRNFSAKARCARAALERLARDEFEVVGFVDADISFAPDHVSYLMAQFESDDRLGVAGTPYADDPQHPQRHAYAHRHADLNHVSGACQFFRRDCYESVGGYRELTTGGVDWVAVTTARMQGWRTQTFTDRVCLHHRPIGTAGRTRVQARYDQGRKAQATGGLPLWETLKGLALLTRPPRIRGGLAFLWGYYQALAQGRPVGVDPALVSFRRAEQARRLRQWCSPWQSRITSTAPTWRVERLPWRGRHLEHRVWKGEHGRVVVRPGLWQTAQLWDEEWQDQPVSDPVALVQQLMRSGRRPPCLRLVGLDAHSRTQLQAFTTCRVRWEDTAQISTQDVESWWASLPQETRKNVRRAKRRAVEVRPVVLDERLAQGIAGIYNESPTRQGRTFWHFGKDVRTVLSDNGSYAERSQFLGAYWRDELVGFLKWVKVGDQARIMQILSLQRHHDKRVMTALIAQAVVECHAHGLRSLIYGRMHYTSASEDALVQFKRRHGFDAVAYPVVIAALTPWGRWCVRMGWDRPWAQHAPARLVGLARGIRRQWWRAFHAIFNVPGRDQKLAGVAQR